VKSKPFRVIITCLATVILITSCGTNNNAGNYNAKSNENLRMNKWNQGEGGLNNINDLSQDRRIIALMDYQDKQYAPANELLDALEFQYEWDSATQTFSIGRVDVLYRITMGSNKAEKEEEPIELSEVPIMINGTSYFPVSVLNDLFSEEVADYALQEDRLVVFPTQEDTNIGNPESDTEQNSTDGEPFFQDDPEAPAETDDNENEDQLEGGDQEVWEQLGDNNAIPTLHNEPLKNINISSLIRRAKRYKGVPYKFGAGPYPRTGKFDCSSYTKYVFGKYGVKLYRVSRNQAKQGKYVSRKKLRKGDLLFFSVPGRFSSDKVVGHVGIYIGNGKMINTYSKKRGVHITTVNTGYWPKKFLKARRVAY
jgi:cell wall-associated NlpC family hydrolase